MATQRIEKGISLREGRKKPYIITLRIPGRKNPVQEAAETLDKARELKLEMQRRYKLLPTLNEKKDEPVPTLKAAFKSYIEYLKKTKGIRYNTERGYFTTLNHYSKYLGNTDIDRITTETWQSLIAKIQDDNNITAFVIKRDISRISSLYKHYIKLGTITYNPLAGGIDVKKTEKEERRAFTKQEKYNFLKTADSLNRMYYIIFRLYFETGMRKGELLALRWQDVDFDQRCLHIRHQIAKASWEGEGESKSREQLTKPKTKQSIRDIPLSASMLEILRLGYKSKQRQPEDFVFQAKGKFITTVRIGRIFEQVRNAANLPNCLTIHCIRHTWAGDLVTAGVDLKTIMEIGGWKTTKILMEIYAHSNLQTKRAAIDRLWD